MSNFKAKLFKNRALGLSFLTYGFDSWNVGKGAEKALVDICEYVMSHTDIIILMNMCDRLSMTITSHVKKGSYCGKVMPSYSAAPPKEL